MDRISEHKIGGKGTATKKGEKKTKKVSVQIYSNFDRFSALKLVQHKLKLKYRKGRFTLVIVLLWPH